MGRNRAIPPELPMTKEQGEILQQIANRHKTRQQIAKRSRIILLASQQQPHSVISEALNVSVNTVKSWRKRWLAFQKELDASEDASELYSNIVAFLQDLPRKGSPPKFTAAQRQQIVALACDKPINHGLEMTDWTFEMLALTAQAKGIVESISKSHVRLILKNAAVTTA